MKQLLTLILIVLLITFTGTVSARAETEQGSIELQSVAEIEREVFNEEGMKVMKRFPAGRVVPGTVVIFTNNYLNIIEKPAENVVITNPIPEHMTYVEGSAAGADMAIDFSVDGNKTYDTPENLTVTGENGRERKALASEYTGIRWTLKRPLQPEEKGSVSFRAILQ